MVIEYWVIKLRMRDERLAITIVEQRVIVLSFATHKSSQYERSHDMLAFVVLRVGSKISFILPPYPMAVGTTNGRTTSVAQSVIKRCSIRACVVRPRLFLPNQICMVGGYIELLSERSVANLANCTRSFYYKGQGGTSTSCVP